MRPLAVLLALAALLAAGRNPLDAMGLPRPIVTNTSAGANAVRAASDAYARGDFAGAQRRLAGAVRLPGDVATATFDLGMVEWRRGDRRAGDRDMNRGITLAGNHDLGVARAALVKVRDGLLAQERAARH